MIFNEFVKLDFYVHDILEYIHSVLQQNQKLKIQIFFVYKVAFILLYMYSIWIFLRRFNILSCFLYLFLKLPKKKRYLEKLRILNCSNNLSISLNLLIRNFWKIVQKTWKFGNKFALPSITHLVLDLPRNLRFPEPDKSHKTKVNLFCFSIGLNFKNRSDLLWLHKIK